MKVINVFFILSLCLFISCKESAKTNAIAEVVKEENIDSQDIKDNTTVEVNASIILDIEGMTCEMGCGSVIRKNLYNYGGVSQCSFDFKTNRVSNTVEIKYDSTIIQPNTIIETINNIDEGDFKANVHSKKSIKEESTSNSQTEESIVNVGITEFSFPSLSEIINSFF